MVNDNLLKQKQKTNLLVLFSLPARNIFVVEFIIIELQIVFSFKNIPIS